MMREKVFLLVLACLVLPLFAGAEDLAVTCQQISSAENSCQSLSTADCQAILQRCADYYDSQSAAIAQDLSKTAQQKNTLQNAVSALRKKITGLEGQIAKGTLMVKDLSIQINDTQASIDKTEAKIIDLQNQITAVLRSVHAEDRKPALLVLLEGTLSDFFNNIAYLESLNAKVSDLLENTNSLKSYLEQQQGKQEAEKIHLQKTIQVQSLQKKENEQNKKHQDALLKLTEAQYQEQQKAKADADKKAAAIKSRIFDLIGVSKAPTFEEAYAIAKYVSGIAGVRPAFLLAILTQESNIGKNNGQCYVTDTVTGNGTSLQGATRKRVMNPQTIPSFITLTNSLGMDFMKTPVSCWIPLYQSNGNPYGWGGAMGPAQFISSTWNIYQDRVTQITGKKANPWNINDAFLASGLLLKANGALSSESVAAAKYYCGGNYGRSECRAYANSVLRYAAQYQEDITAIGG